MSQLFMALKKPSSECFNEFIVSLSAEKRSDFPEMVCFCKTDLLNTVDDHVSHSQTLSKA